MASGAQNMQNHVLVNLFNANGLRPKLWDTERDAGGGGGIVGARFRGRWSPGCCGSDYDPPTCNHMAEACLPPGQKKSSHIWLGCLRNQTEYVCPDAALSIKIMASSFASLRQLPVACWLPSQLGRVSDWMGRHWVQE
ncbi:hypothetical protein ACLKA6_003512 [Drosophila palustris]